MNSSYVRMEIAVLETSPQWILASITRDTNTDKRSNENTYHYYGERKSHRRTKKTASHFSVWSQLAAEPNHLLIACGKYTNTSTFTRMSDDKTEIEPLNVHMFVLMISNTKRASNSSIQHYALVFVNSIQAEISVEANEMLKYRYSIFNLKVD